MEKLLELLEEKTGKEWLYTLDAKENGFDNNFFHTKEGGESMEISYVISKEFWFIQWLIKHYYIELPMWLWRIKRKNEDWTLDYYSDEESLLMLLAISDDPIGLLLKLI